MGYTKIFLQIYVFLRIDFVTRSITNISKLVWLTLTHKLHLNLFAFLIWI